MPYDAFISHSNAAKLTAYAICNELEASGIRCWILPRDLAAGAGWDQSIAKAVESSRIVILVLTDYGHRSDRVERQLELAFNSGAVVIPFRVESDPVPSEAADTPNPLHWIDAMTPDVAHRIRSLHHTVRGIVEGNRNSQLQVTNHQGARLTDAVAVSISAPQELTGAGDETAAETVIPSDSGGEKRAVSIRNNADNSRAINALALTILPFLVVCVIGIWLASHRRQSARPKLIQSRVAAAAEPLPPPSARPVLLTPVVAIPTPILPTPSTAVEAVRSPVVPIRTTPPVPLAPANATPAAPVVTVTPLPAQVMQRMDEISPSDPGWGTPDANWTVADNKIRLTPLPGNGAILVNTAHHFKDAEFATAVVMSKGDDLDQLGGLIFWAKDYNDCYALVVSADGKFAIGRKLFGRWINPTAKTGSGAVRTGIGQVNKLQLRTSGKTFTASINDVQVATLSGDPPEGEWLIGLYGESGESSGNSWDFSKVGVATTHRETP